MRRTGIGLAVAGSLILSAGCSSGTETSAPQAETTAPDMGVLADHVDMAGFAFEPSQVTLEQGSDLTVTNKDSVTHTFTMDDGSIDETLEPGQTADVTIASAGGFHCDIHKSMTGTVSFG